jgi:hypothetical protein
MSPFSRKKAYGGEVRLNRYSAQEAQIMEGMPIEDIKRLYEALEKFKDNNICFVIAPIGDPGSEIRRRSDQILEFVIQPAAEDCKYNEVIRADQISEQGIITNQVIQHIIEARMVVADLTDRNPNVFYELAIRHAIRRPCVQIIQKGEKIPFDVALVRTIEVDHHDLYSVAAAKLSLVKSMLSMKGNREVDSPISAAVGIAMLRNVDEFTNEVREMNTILRKIAEALSE